MALAARLQGTGDLLPDADGCAAQVRAIDLLNESATLRASYLLQFGSDPGAPALDEEIATRFLLWFAVEGRHQCQHIRFSPDYVAFLAAPQPPFATRLAAYVHARRRKSRHARDDDVEAFHAWYYTSGAHQLRLTPLLVARERRFLAEPHPRFARHGHGLSRWDCFRYIAHRQAQARPGDRSAGDERAIRAWLKADPAAGPAAWHNPQPLWDHAGLPGINVIGSADGVSGIGEDARALSEALLGAGVQQSIFNVRYSARVMASDPSGREVWFADRPLYPINVFCLPAFETVRLKLACGENLFAGRYNVGYWPWELTSLPRTWRFAFDLVDEIWASSRFLVDVFQGITSKPVTYMPPHVGLPDSTPFARKSLGLSPRHVIFLCMFDFNSYLARKNPMAAIEAFRLAFPERDGPERLLIKTINGQSQPPAVRELQRHVAMDERIVHVDGGLTREEICGLLQGVDCYVSLHRAEGFGRILAEAMLLGTPVIATDWSGSASFVNPGTGFPVSRTLRGVRPDEYVYAEGSVWAEPSIEDAARKMRLVRHDRRAVEAIRLAAGHSVRQTYGLGPAASRISTWLRDFAAKSQRSG